jgi:hypothetical protein
MFIASAPELGAGIDPGMALTPFPSRVLDETSFEPTTSGSFSLTTRLDCRPYDRVILGHINKNGKRLWQQTLIYFIKICQP